MVLKVVSCWSSAETLRTVIDSSTIGETRGTLHPQRIYTLSTVDAHFARLLQ